MPDAVTTRTWSRVIDVPVQLPDGSTTITTQTQTQSVMMIKGPPVEKVYQQAVTQMAIEQSLQRRQIDYLKAQAIKAGWDMSKFPLK